MYPILFKIGPINLYTYGFFLSLGFLVAILVASREAKRTGLSVEHFFDLCFYLILAAIVGSRLLRRIPLAPLQRAFSLGLALLGITMLIQLKYS